MLDSLKFSARLASARQGGGCATPRSPPPRAAGALGVAGRSAKTLTAGRSNFMTVSVYINKIYDIGQSDHELTALVQRIRGGPPGPPPLTNEHSDKIPGPPIDRRLTVAAGRRSNFRQLTYNADGAFTETLREEERD